MKPLTKAQRDALLALQSLEARVGEPTESIVHGTVAGGLTARGLVTSRRGCSLCKGRAPHPPSTRGRGCWDPARRTVTFCTLTDKGRNEAACLRVEADTAAQDALDAQGTVEVPRWALAEFCPRRHIIEQRKVGDRGHAHAVLRAVLGWGEDGADG